MCLHCVSILVCSKLMSLVEYDFDVPQFVSVSGQRSTSDALEREQIQKAKLSM